MRKSLLMLVLTFLLLYLAPNTAEGIQSNPLTPEEKSFLWYKDFVSSCLGPNIMESIKMEYNISQGGYGYENRYEKNIISYGLQEGYDGFVIVVYVRPNHVDHLDRLTFYVKPHLIQYGKVIQLSKYERAVDS